MPWETEQLFSSASSNPIPIVVAVVTTLIASVALFQRSRSAKWGEKAKDDGRLSSSSHNKTTTSSNSSRINNSILKNIWDTARSQSPGDDKKSYQDKPFGSKYYYAHNNPNATGGYKDGLKMEDYTMNGPRLLSKGGKPVDDGSNKQNLEREEELAPSQKDTNEQKRETEISNAKITLHDPSVTYITKYLWDDPGDWNGVATIRIESLPFNNEFGKVVMMDWKDITVKNVEANLVGEGLLVEIETTKHGAYQLKISKLYGEAASVKTITKPKRLLVQISKKKNSFMSGRDKSNLNAWPQPHRKV